MIGLFLAFPGAAAAQKDTVRLQLKWWHQFQFAGYYAALQQGYYAQEGINVKIIPGSPGIEPVNEVLKGKATFGVTGSDLLLDYVKQRPVVALGVIFQHSPYIILTTKDKNIHVPSDLVGKKVMVSESQGWVVLKAMLLKEGIPPNAVKKIPHTWKNADLVDGKSDAMSAYSSVEPWQLHKLGAEPVVINPSDYGVDFYGDILFTHADVAKKNPGEVEKFMNASYKGWDYAMKHRSEIADYILSLPGVKERGVTKEDLLNEAAEMDTLIEPNLIEIGHMNEGRWNSMLATYKQLKLVPENAGLKGFLYNPEAGENKELIRTILIVTGVIVVVLLLLLVNIYTLRKLVRNRTAELEKVIVQKDVAQAQLQQSEERLELAIEASGLGIWDWDVENQTVYVNDKWKAMLGYGPDEISGNADDFEKLLHPEERDELLHEFKLRMDGLGTSYTNIVRLKTKSGAWKWILTSSKSVMCDETGKALRISGVHVDVDDIKQKEIALDKLTRELMYTNNELRQFAYITSHNLRAPAINLSSLLVLWHSSKTEAERGAIIGKMELSTRRLIETMDNLNEILSSRVTNEDVREELSFEQEFVFALEQVSEQQRTTKAEIHADFSAVPSLLYSKKALDSIFLNLLTNAMRYAKKDTPPEINIRTIKENRQMILEVSDKGQGIDLEKYGSKLFNLYERFHPGQEGKGLGLYIIRNQVETLGGKIEVRSKPGEGATFRILFENK